MTVEPVSSQNFQGRVIGCSWFKTKHKNIFKQVKPCLEKMVKNKDYDLQIYSSYGKLRIGIWKYPDYIEPEANSDGAWISGVKELINGFENDRRKIK